MELKLVDAGTVSALRSQSLWHGIASAMTPDSSPTLSFCRPGEPYVCLGYHRSLDEVDLAACRARGLPILRRQIGGGPVYIDEDQLFFQITLPVRLAPARVDDLYKRYLRPAVTAFQTLGLPAALRGVNDIAVGQRKICGTGAGQIGEAVTVVGNVIFRFPHERMAEVLALPSESLRRECLRLMRRHVSSLEAEGRPQVGCEAAKAALSEAYARELGCEGVPAALDSREQACIETWERRLADPAWVEGPGAGRPAACRVKVCEDVWAVAAAEDGLRVEASLVAGRIENARVEGDGLDGVAARIAGALAGQTLAPDELGRCLEAYGEAGRRVLALLARGLGTS